MGGISRRGLGVVVLAALALAPFSVAGASVAGVNDGTVVTPLEPVQIGAPALIVTHGGDVPDPFVLKVGSSFLLFYSQSNFYGDHIPLRVSGSLTDWNTPAIDAMPTLPIWANDGFIWGPDVRRVGSHYVMWFSAPLRSSGNTLTKCIGVAVSRSPYGPYQPGTRPIICQLNHLGSIDPRSFVDKQGRLWLTWKSDDNADVNGTTHSTIWVQRVSRDGLGVVGSPRPLITADQPWEGRIVEAPDMVYAAGHYWLF
jgi:arabinan endo-1,5-alpha-L-arabinosidase